METVPAKTIVTRNKSTEWFGCEYNMNIYRGCCHGCIYCDSRSECYRVDDFDTVRVKKDALFILNRELRSRRKIGVAGIGAMSDTYNPFEKELQITRGALELIEKYGFGVALDTKSDLVTRDIDLFQAITQKHSAIVKITITTADNELARIIEPHAPAPSQRFDAIKKLSEAGVYCGVLFTPTLPFITDTKETIEQLVKKAADHGARFIYHMEGVTMRDRQRAYFYEKVTAYDEKLPDLYRQTFGDRYMCTSPHAKENRAYFHELCKTHHLEWRMSKIIEAYKKEPEPQQTSLF